MPLTRRHFLGSAVAAATLPLIGEDAMARELAPIFASEANEVPYKFRRREVDYETTEVAGTIVVDTEKRFLYHVLGNGRAMRYGVGVGDDGKQWTGRATIRRKVEWPIWRPTPEHIAKYPKLEKWRVDGMPGGRENPMGARPLSFPGQGRHALPHPRHQQAQGCWAQGDVRVPAHAERRRRPSL